MREITEYAGIYSSRNAPRLSPLAGRAAVVQVAFCTMSIMIDKGSKRTATLRLSSREEARLSMA